MLKTISSGARLICRAGAMNPVRDARPYRFRACILRAVRRPVMTVDPAWIDYNGHLNMAYYNVLFDRAVDEAFELLGLGLDYVKSAGTLLHRRSARALPARAAGQRPGAGDVPAARLRRQAHALSSSSCSTRPKAGCRRPPRTCRCTSTWRAKKVAPFPPDVAQRLSEMKAIASRPAAPRSRRPPDRDAGQN